MNQHPSTPARRARALILGGRVWHALLEFGLVVGLWVLLRLVVRDAVAIFRTA